MLRANLPSSSGTVCRTARKLRLPFFLANLFSFLLIGRRGRIITGVRVGGAIPGEALAGNSGGVAGGGLVDGQVQGINM